MMRYLVCEVLGSVCLDFAVSVKVDILELGGRKCLSCTTLARVAIFMETHNSGSLDNARKFSYEASFPLPFQSQRLYIFTTS